MSIVSTWGRAISPSPPLSAPRLSASLLLAGFWFSSSLLGQAFSWLCYCLLPLGPLPQCHSPLTGKLDGWLAVWLVLSVCVLVCISVYVRFYLLKGSETRAPEDRGDYVFVQSCLFVVGQCRSTVKWFHIVLKEINWPKTEITTYDSKKAYVQKRQTEISFERTKVRRITDFVLAGS